MREVAFMVGRITEPMQDRSYGNISYRWVYSKDAVDNASYEDHVTSNGCYLMVASDAEIMRVGGVFAIRQVKPAIEQGRCAVWRLISQLEEKESENVEEKVNIQQ